ncbi:MAG TPA: FAD-dependent oxidoreductase, partial [Thermoanaerobaculia bacterium]|nr:FAD-dependent oxidoreductase [Thermoanaerobaculia bacterium]
MRYDLVVIGSGPAGEKGAAQAAYFGRRVALIERASVVGGASVNTGTIPSKTLRESALHLSGFRQRNLYGVDLSLRKDLTVADLMYRKQQVVEREWERVEENLERHQVHRFHGTARFRSPQEIVVSSEAGEEVVEADVILIATGSSPYHPPGIPFDHRLIYDSDSILHLDRIPESLVVVGAGVIGCEYASIFAALGVRVTLVDGRSELLGHVDRELLEVLLETFRHRLKIEIRLGSDVARFDARDDGVVLHLGDGSRIESARALIAAGRQSNTVELDLDAAGVIVGKRGLIPVDERYQTNVPGIYAA